MGLAGFSAFSCLEKHRPKMARARAKDGQAGRAGRCQLAPDILCFRARFFGARRTGGYRLSFLLDRDLQRHGNILVQVDGDGEVTQSLQRLINLDLAPVNGDAFVLQRARDVG